MVISSFEIIFICFLLLYCQIVSIQTNFKVLLYLSLQRDKLVYYQGTIKLFHVMRSETNVLSLLKIFSLFHATRISDSTLMTPLCRHIDMRTLLYFIVS